MGGEESREEKELDNLPIVAKKYKMCTLLGKGHFGGVYKVQNINTKEFFAMKCVPVDAQPGVNKNQQKVVYQTALTEKDILSRLNHPNIVKMHESFVCPRNPARQKEKSKSKKQDRWFCIIIEYCRGNTLEAILRQVEETSAKIEQEKRGVIDIDNVSPKKKSKKKEKTKEFKIPRDICLIWFIKLLDAVSFFHEKRLIHCDLHAENVLLKYTDLYDFHNIELRISDFGVAKDISRVKKRKDLPMDLSGHIFYSAPEVIAQKGYGCKADIFALGLLFLNLYTQMSMQRYIADTQRIFLKIKQNPELRDELCEKYKIKEYVGVHRLPDITMLAFIHSEQQMMTRNLFKRTLIDNVVTDPGVTNILGRMISPVLQRATSKQLQNSKIIRTWKHLLLSKDENFDIEESEFLKFYSVQGIITVMKMKDERLFDRCLRILKMFILHNPVAFVKHGGIEVLFKRMNGVRKILLSKNESFNENSKSKTEKKKRTKSVMKRKMIRNTVLKLHRATINPQLNQDLLKFECLMSDIIGLTTCVLCYLQISNHLKLYDEELKKICLYVRKFECLTTLESLLKFQRNDSIYYFTYLISSNSISIRSYLSTRETLRSLIKNMNVRNQNYVVAILASLMTELSRPNLIYTLDEFKKHVPDLKRSNDLRFFKRCKFKSAIYKQLLHSLYQEILNLVGRSKSKEKDDIKSEEKEEDELNLLLDENEESNMVRLLCSIIFTLEEFDQSQKFHKVEKLRLDETLMKKPNSVEISSKCRASKGIEMLVEVVGETVFEVRVTKKSKLENDILTKMERRQVEVCSKVICKYSNRGADEVPEEVNVCYFEVYCDDGGFKDDLVVGFTSSAMKPCQIHMHLATGDLIIKKLGEKETQVYDKYFLTKEEIEEIESVEISGGDTSSIKPKFSCATGDSIGVGLTNYGRVFWTKNNQVMNPGKFVQFFEDHMDTKIPVSIRASSMIYHNFGFRGRFILPNHPNFIPFRFKFGEILPDKLYRCIEQKVRDRMKNRTAELGSCKYFLEEVNKFGEIDRIALNFVRQQGDPGNAILSLAREKYSSNEFICQLISKIENYGSEESESKGEEEQDGEGMTSEELQNILLMIYREPCYQEKIITRYFQLTSSEYKKNFEKFGAGNEEEEEGVIEEFEEEVQGEEEKVKEVEEEEKVEVKKDVKVEDVIQQIEKKFEKAEEEEDKMIQELQKMEERKKEVREEKEEVGEKKKLAPKKRKKTIILMD